MTAAPLPSLKSDSPYPAPAPDAPLRLVIVGQRTYFEACALTRPAAGIEPTFVDFRARADAEAMRAAVERARPHVVVVFRPELVPAGTFADLRVPVIGYLTEPLPRAPEEENADLRFRLSEFRLIDPDNVDRLVAFDPYIAASADQHMRVWRSVPLPVSDRFYANVRPMSDDPRAVFVGRSSPRREQWLINAKHEVDLLHLAHGVDADRLAEALREAEIGVNVHLEPYPTFENRVAFHLAAGHLTISEALDPLHGLEPGLDFLVADTPDQLLHYIVVARRFPDSFHRVRIRGRMKAERFRASVVYPRLVHDVFADLAAFGTARAAAG